MAAFVMTRSPRDDLAPASDSVPRLRSSHVWPIAGTMYPRCAADAPHGQAPVRARARRQPPARGLASAPRAAQTPRARAGGGRAGDLPHDTARAAAPRAL